MPFPSALSYWLNRMLAFSVFSCCHVCWTLPASVMLSDIFSLNPLLHPNHQHLLSLQLSMPNRLTGLWQKMLVDLWGAPGSTGACLTCISLERHYAPFCIFPKWSTIYDWTAFNIPYCEHEAFWCVDYKPANPQQVKNKMTHALESW